MNKDFRKRTHRTVEAIKTREFTSVNEGGDIVKAEVNVRSREFLPQDLRTIMRSPKNVRRFIGTEFTNRSYFEDIKNTGVIQDSVTLYMIDPNDQSFELEGHEKGTFYAANGWTRIQIADYLYAKNDDDHREINVNAEIYTIKKGDEWVIDRLRDLSDSNELFSWFEDSIRIHQLYLEHVQGAEIISGRQFQNLVETHTMRKRKYNRDSFNLKLQMCFYAESIIKILSPYVTDLGDIKGEIASSIGVFLKGYTGNDLAIQVQQSSLNGGGISNNLEQESKNIWDDGLERLSEIALEVHNSIGEGKNFISGLNAALKKELKSDVKNAESKPVVSIKLTKKGAKAKADINLDRSEFDEDAYEKALDILNTLEQRMNETIKEIDALKIAK
ncbi:hypothetical protein V6259_12535 [Marinomonas sp. TI.3.20]|uniref:hypothetical protein n=1 Tax=Marinomonas sp. TI.3.20 TaxID=3121296 RepID=UPI00311FA899